MTKAELEKLAERAEAADAIEQRAILIEAWRRVEGGICPELDAGNHLHPRYRQFADFIQVGAFIDAAMMLVPEGWHIEIGIYRADDDLPEEIYARVSLDVGGDGPRWESIDRSQSATPALALCAASLRATTTGEAK